MAHVGMASTEAWHGVPLQAGKAVIGPLEGRATAGATRARPKPTRAARFSAVTFIVGVFVATVVRLLTERVKARQEGE